jgi:hypothetical protein
MHIGGSKPQGLGEKLAYVGPLFGALATASQNLQHQTAYCATEIAVVKL